jgi:two-component system cell cycle response regulator
MDVDQFKSYNDSYGHPAGDEALKQVAQVLRNFSRRPGDLAARYGGEEFVVIAAETNIQLALAIAESIRAGVEALAQVHQHSQHGVLTVSIGVAVSTPGQTANLEALLNMADTALYTAKNAGRNRVEWSVSGSETLTPARAC